MQLILSLVAAAALAAQGVPPAAVASFLDAVAAGDLATARSILSDGAMIVDESEGNDASSLDLFAERIRGCERTGLTWDVDQEDSARAASVVTWTCPSGASAEAFIWTERAKVVAIQFGPSSR